MSDTIAAIATPQAAGGIGIVRISGESAIAIADRVFRAVNGIPLTKSAGYAAHLGHVRDENETLDEAIALVFRAPKSYTGEDVVELSCHGGLYIIRRVLRAVLSHGARMAEAGEFTRRAFENGKIDLTQAEAVMDIISASGEQAAKAALSVMEGKLAGKINLLKEQLTGYAAHLAAWADYPEEDLIPVDPAKLSFQLEDCACRLRKLIADGDAGRLLRDGVDTVIVGKPNVGKSTLMNCLAGCERSIVTHIAGTTRDIVEDKVLVGDVILNLADTAGIHDTFDPVERIGVARAKSRMNRASLVIAVFDNSLPLDEDDIALIDEIKGLSCVAVINKTDMESRLDVHYIAERISNVIFISAKEESGIEALGQAVAELLGTSSLNPADGILSGERQINCCRNCLQMVEEAREALSMGMTLDAVNVSLDCAIHSLLELTGEKVTEVVTDAVFHRFCVGK
ncbi:MAG: tRNA uridine-5-carboxymethylaminomethyl(34) synthesis GTPase MnmE [Clostridia bacterium]|nr:tRNA uridine-5-carboxymethylaminomethyl(34) synthesis GTPase MnmE [Clostridia bacterium]